MRKGVIVGALLSGVLAGPAATGGPVNDNAYVEIKVKFKPPSGPKTFAADNYLVKKLTTKAVKSLLTEANGVTTDMYRSDKVKWDHISVDEEGGYVTSYVQIRFKHGDTERERAEALYEVVKKFKSHDNYDADGVYKQEVEDYLRGKLDKKSSYTDSEANCENNGGKFKAADSYVCVGYDSCMKVSCDDAECSACASTQYGENNSYNCTTMQLTSNHCDNYVSSSSADLARTCRDEYGFFYSNTAMKCTGTIYTKTGYKEVYACKTLADLTKCWDEEGLYVNNTCSECQDYTYLYTDSNNKNKLKNCAFEQEDPSGYCLFGYCRNDGCGVYKLDVTLGNVPDDSILGVGEIAAFAFLGVAVLFIAIAQFVKPRFQPL